MRKCWVACSGDQVQDGWHCFFQMRIYILGAMVIYIFQCYRGGPISHTTSAGLSLLPNFAPEIPCCCEKPVAIWTDYERRDISSSSEAIELSADGPITSTYNHFCPNVAISFLCVVKINIPRFCKVILRSLNNSEKSYKVLHAVVNLECVFGLPVT